MARRALLIDCDPGVDDAVALLFALSHPEIEVVGIATVAGNVDAAKTARNARLIVELAGRADVPVAAGCDRPLLREPVEAGEFHGPEGLGPIPILDPASGPVQGHGALKLIEWAMARPAKSVSLAVLGPMTNVALALRLEPRLASHLDAIAIMGGARAEGGNVTATAEFNVFADPHAAAIVLASGAEIALFGLDVTHRVRSTPARVDRLRARGTRAAIAAADLMDFSNAIPGNGPRDGGAPLHDPCPNAWLVRPDLFELAPARIEVETGSALTLGATSVEFRGGRPNARWATGADADGIFSLIEATLSR